MNPASEQTNSTPAVCATEMMTLLRRLVRKWYWPKMTRKLCQTGAAGQRCGGILNISPRAISEPDAMK